MKLKDIEALPVRERGLESIYDSIMIVNSWKKHDSWWAIMYIVWLDNKQEPIEIAAQCDDINRIINKWKRLSELQDVWISKNVLRTDCFYKWNIRVRSGYWRLKVGMSLSSTNIELILDDKLL